MSATQAEIKRAIEGARKAGFPIGTIEITKDGTIRIITPDEAKPKAPPVEDFRL